MKKALFEAIEKGVAKEVPLRENIMPPQNPVSLHSLRPKDNKAPTPVKQNALKSALSALTGNNDREEMKQPAPAKEKPPEKKAEPALAPKQPETTSSKLKEIPEDELKKMLSL